MAPAVAAPARAAATPSLVALSDDPTLLEALTGAAMSGVNVITSPTADRFIDQLVANAPDIALIDASSTPAPLAEFIAALHQQFPLLLLIAAGPAPMQSQCNAQLAAGTLFRFVHKPASSQRLRLFIDTALRTLAPEDAPMASPQVRDAFARMSGAALAAGAAAAGAIAAGAVAWAVWHRASSP